MMKPYFKGIAASIKPMYSGSLIHPRCMVNYSACGGETHPNVWAVHGIKLNSLKISRVK